MADDSPRCNEPGCDGIVSRRAYRAGDVDNPVPEQVNRATGRSVSPIERRCTRGHRQNLYFERRTLRTRA